MGITGERVLLMLMEIHYSAFVNPAKSRFLSESNPDSGPDSGLC